MKQFVQNFLDSKLVKLLYMYESEFWMDARQKVASRDLEKLEKVFKSFEKV